MTIQPPQIRFINLSESELDQMIEREARALTGLSAKEAFRRIDQGKITRPEIVEELDMLRALRA